MLKKTNYSSNFTTKCSYTAYKHNETGVLPNCWKHLRNRPTSNTYWQDTAHVFLNVR